MVQPRIIEKHEEETPEMNSEITVNHVEIVETTQQFLAFFASVEEEIEKGQEIQIQKFFEDCDLSIEHYQKEVEKLELAIKILDSLKDNYDFVNRKTSGLENQCEEMLDYQVNFPLNRPIYLQWRMK